MLRTNLRTISVNTYHLNRTLISEHTRTAVLSSFHQIRSPNLSDRGYMIFVLEGTLFIEKQTGEIFTFDITDFTEATDYLEIISLFPWLEPAFESA